MFWGGLWLWRRQLLGYLVAAVLLVKGGLLGLTMVINTWLATAFWGVPMDIAVPVYALGGVGGLALALAYLRRVEPPESSRIRAGVIVESYCEPIFTSEQMTEVRRVAAEIERKPSRALASQHLLSGLVFAHAEPRCMG